MVICNMKLNFKLIFKIIFIILLIGALIMFGIGIYKVFFNKYETTQDSDTDTSKVSEISPKNYTNVLQEVHNHIDDYVGKKIKFTGFIYRLFDFKDDQFVLAREMVISSNYQGVVVGFLCHLANAKQYTNRTWVTIEGTITKGEYHGEIPVIEVEKIEQTKIPSEEYVLPPDNTYVKTSNQI